MIVCFVVIMPTPWPLWTIYRSVFFSFQFSFFQKVGDVVFFLFYFIWIFEKCNIPRKNCNNMLRFVMFVDYAKRNAKSIVTLISWAIFTSIWVKFTLRDEMQLLDSICVTQFFHFWDKIILISKIMNFQNHNILACTIITFFLFPK